MDTSDIDPQIDRAFDTEDAFDHLFKNDDNICCMTRAEWNELQRRAELGRIIEEAPSLVPDELGASVIIEFRKGKFPTVRTSSLLFPSTDYVAQNIAEAFAMAKAAKR